MKDFYNFISEEEEEKRFTRPDEDEICKQIYKCKTVIEKYKIRYESSPNEPMIVAKENLLPKPFNGIHHSKFKEPWLTVSFKEFTELAMAYAYILKNKYNIQPQSRVAILANSVPINHLLVTALWFIRAVVIEVSPTIGEDIKQSWMRMLDVSMCFYDVTFKPKDVDPEILKKDEWKWKWRNPLNEDELDLVAGIEGIRMINMNQEQLAEEIVKNKEKGLFVMEEGDPRDSLSILGTSSSAQAVIKNGQQSAMKFVTKQTFNTGMKYNNFVKKNVPYASTTLSVPPFYHGIGLHEDLIHPQQTGGPLVYRTQNPDSLGIIPEMLLDDLADLDVHEAVIFPYIYAEFKKLKEQNHPKWPKWEKMLRTRIRGGFKVAGAPPIPGINKWLREECGFYPCEEYGSTEGGIVLSSVGDLPIAGEEGYLPKIPYNSIYLEPLNENDENLGEIYIHTDQLFTGYVKRLEKGEVSNPECIMPGLRNDYMAEGNFRIIDGIKFFKMNDIFRRSPITGQYKHIARVDDILTFSTGIKMNPIPFETTIQSSCENVKICTLLLDSTKTEVICFIEPEWKFIKDENGEFIDATRDAEILSCNEINNLTKLAQDQIWNNIYNILHEETGSLANWAKQFSKDNIFVIKYGEKYPVTAKGNPSKKVVKVLYQEVLDNISRVIQGEITMDDVFKMEEEKYFGKKTENKNEENKTTPSIKNNGNSNENEISNKSVKSVKDMMMIIFQSLKEHNTMLLEFKDFDPEKSFKFYGIDSLAIIKFTKSLSRKLNKKYMPSILYNYGTPMLLAKFLVDEELSNKEKPVDSIPSLFGNNNSNKIAIIGMGIRLPGAIDNEKKLWSSLIKGKDCVLPLPKNRKLHLGYVKKPTSELKDGEHNVPRVGYYDSRPNVAKHTQFDASFFNCTPEEATGLDVKHRWILETSWEALENAGISPDSLENSNTGVFIGMGDGQELNKLIEENGLVNAIGSHNSSPSAIAGRLGYFYKLYGPSVTVDTACSTGATALHTACRLLTFGDCDLSIVSAASFMYLGSGFEKTSRARMTSPNGRCATFDASADGFATSEGCVTYILKRLEDAERDNDNILGVILGTSSGQSGIRQSISSPSSEGQAINTKKVLKMANVEPSQISYVEAHGTGTPLGDALEIHGLNQVYKDSHSKENPLIVGSIKSNIGHTCEVAGLAGIAKVLVSMKHKAIPKNIHFKKLNPEIELDLIPITIPTRTTPWNVKNENEPRIAQVSSYGLQGSIVTIILQEYIPKKKEICECENNTTTPTTKCELEKDDKHVLIVSAKDKSAMIDLNNKYMQILENTSETESVANLCYTTNIGRQHFGNRIAAIGKTALELSKDLQNQHDKFLEKDMNLNNIKNSEEKKIIEEIIHKRKMSKYITMTCSEDYYRNIDDSIYKSAAYLYHTQPVFMNTIDMCEKIVADISNNRVSLIKIIMVLGENDDLELINSCKKEINKNAYMNQFVKLAFHFAISKLLESLGLSQNIVIGHRFGELVSAVVTGKLELTHAFSLIQHINEYRNLKTTPTEEDMTKMIENWIKEPNETENFTYRDVDKVSIKQKIFYSCNEQTYYVKGEKLPLNYWKSYVNKFVNISNSDDVESEKINNEEFEKECQKVMAKYEREIIYHINMSINNEIEKCVNKCIKNVNNEKNDIILIPQSSLYKNGDMNENIIKCIRNMFEEGIEIDWNNFHKRFVYRTRKEYELEKVTLPNYPFQRSRFWPIGN